MELGDWFRTERNHLCLLTYRPQTSIRGGDDQDTDRDLHGTFRDFPE